MDCDRRLFLKTGFAAMVCLLSSQSGYSAIGARPVNKTLNFYNTHTGERVTADYYVSGKYQPRELGKIDHILRDHRTGTVYPIDRRLMDILFDIQNRLKFSQPYHVISGYRTISTNAMLARTASGVAKKSLHTRGQAIDIRVPGLKTKTLRNTCVKMRAGGVGYYPRSDFVHVDVGPVRCW